MIWTIPNILTVVRLLAAPLVILVFLVLPHPYADWIALVLFVGAAMTDWFDGYLARAWGQQTKLGTMLDPIADKAMVVVALAALLALVGMDALLVIPTALILFREVFVSGLREFLGDTAGTLKVTRLAKWKTTVQMVAISVLFLHGIFEHKVGMVTFGMDQNLINGVLNGDVEDLYGLLANLRAMAFAWWAGIALIWLAAILTVMTGWDYFQKSLPYLKD
ncbi:CDP-diacylglycerol--glycerol-3-phosphate 3-phosphatidyltransferase [Aliiruegeria haliotis]|uniref:CDP-diacylglycerol--glycerol-3-phosphate 3-phosphatidyltransferase n=1 Tax=Aliiruegeria haliotis TaxID=1280846 RepID=A0A2T0RRQ0_9RHOB|nr:CDP-diacylglycerol--glycerol-3-phosphate 3-phosphatidyltransferase [Aliiruegeria haliotis]PRY23831.1 CDP-diacylglycerol--glycerol-3-phosphate 3-phosphatidyltransferase [Aliiruegeria haliotis]